MKYIIFTILPFVIVGISFVLLINNANKKKGKSNGNTDENYMTTGMSLVMCFGVTAASFFMEALGPIAFSYGISVGMLSGMFIGQTIKKK